MSMDDYRKKSKEFQKYLDENLPKVSLKDEPIKKTYKVTYKETLVHTFYVEASNEEEAKEFFEEDVRDGEIDFSGGEVSDTEYTIKEAR